MTIIHPSKGHSRSVGRNWLPRPRVAFLGTVLAVALCYALAPWVVSADLTTPAITSLLFVLAAAFAVVASSRPSDDRDNVTYWDVAGAMMLIGVCTSALIAPDQLVRIVAGGGSGN